MNRGGRRERCGEESDIGTSCQRIRLTIGKLDPFPREPVDVPCLDLGSIAAEVRVSEIYGPTFSTVYVSD